MCVYSLNNLKCVLWRLQSYKGLKNVVDIKRGGLIMEKKNKKSSGNQALTNKNFVQDIPDQIIWRLLELSEIHCPEISFAICLQATCGISTVEVCNPNWSGEVEVGRIKNKSLQGAYEKLSPVIGNKRLQGAYEKFLPVIEHYHNLHIEHFKSKNIEEEDYPLFVNGHRNALTVKSYSRKFNKLVSNLVNDLIDSNEFVLAELISSIKLTPKTLRQWFVNKLFLNCETHPDLAIYLGHKNFNALVNRYWKR
jgi:hypothetical protein